jgi:hypothetical protein
MAENKTLRQIARSFVADGPSGVSIRDRLKGLTSQDETVLRLVGAHMGRLASRDLARRCSDGLEHSTDTWAERKRDLTTESSSRWAGSVTAGTHDQWGLSRRAQWAHLQSLDAGIHTIRHRLSLPVGQKGGRRLAKQRHNLTAAQKTPEHWRAEWEAARWFPTADGESGKRFGNETVRLTPDGQISIKLPAPLAELANAKHGRYVLAAKVSFPHRDTEWRDRITANRAVAYRIHLNVATNRWYLDASWTRKDLPVIPDSKTREKHGRKKFRQLISGIPTGKLRARLLSMCAEAGIGVIAIDPAYTSMWGAEHWQKPLTTSRRPASRHQAAAVAIGRRALGHRIRRRTAPPRQHQSDADGHRTAQARPGDQGREGNRPRVPGPRTRSAGSERGRNAVDQPIQDRSGRVQCQFDLHDQL